MSKNPKADMLNKTASEPKNQPNRILETLELKEEQTVVDIGSGGGYFTLRFSDIVGKNGRVIAVDIEPKFLDHVKSIIEEKKAANIETILTKKEHLILPEKSADLIFMRNVCHHISDRPQYFRQLKKVLKPDGRVAIIDYIRGNKISFHRIFGHYTDKEKIIEEMIEAGYKLNKDEKFLTEQSFTIYSLKEA